VPHQRPEHPHCCPAPPLPLSPRSWLPNLPSRESERERGGDLRTQYNATQRNATQRNAGQVSGEIASPGSRDGMALELRAWRGAASCAQPTSGSAGEFPRRLSSPFLGLYPPSLSPVSDTAVIPAPPTQAVLLTSLAEPTWRGRGVHTGSRFHPDVLGAKSGEGKTCSTSEHAL
jgi:hypothetical protein